MPGNFKQYDLRIIKTHKALLEALPKLLSQRNFRRITVNDICEESQMSRTAFYSHFNDKYDLLKFWLSKQILQMKSITVNFLEFEEKVNAYIEDNRNLIINLLDEANNETRELVANFISTWFGEFFGAGETPETNPFRIVLFNFCTGGLINLILWQIKHKFPGELKMINVHFYQILEALRELEMKNADGGAENE